LSDHDHGTIETRSGTWGWKLKTFSSWPRSSPTARVLGFEDPANPINTMSLRIEPEDDFSEEGVARLSLTPLRRRFQDNSGSVWIAHPASEPGARRGKAVRKVSLHSLDHETKTTELPPGRTLGDLKNKELVSLV
jgi:hypothetical protein